MTAVKLYVGGGEEMDLDTQLLKDLKQRSYVADLRNILNTAHAVHQQSGGDDGNGSVFCAADLHLAKEGTTALNNIFCQSDTSFQGDIYI
jgi:hypothetical protein